MVLGRDGEAKISSWDMEQKEITRNAVKRNGILQCW